MTLQEFADLFDDFGEWDGRLQVDYITYYLTGIVGQETVSPKEVKECFNLLRMKPYSRIGPYLSEQTTNKKGRYIKLQGEYRLERGVFEKIRREVDEEPKKIAVSNTLSDLLAKVGNTQEHIFLKEAIDCYRVRAFRATIIMVWILCIHHLFRYVFAERLLDFNSALAKNPDKRVKCVTKLEDFSELQESKFIELLRAADIVSNDVRKILDEKLGTRNSAAHPSDISFDDGHKATEFASDLINNVVLKF